MLQVNGRHVPLAVMILAVICLGTMAWANPVPDPWCDWENNETVLNMVGTGEPPIIVSNEAPPEIAPGPYGGQFALRLEDNSPSGTPHADLVHIWGLGEGDQVTVGFWRYDITPDAAPSCRIWAHWNDALPGQIEVDNGSAGGNLDYGAGMGWDYTEHTWTVEGGHTGLVVEARTYSNPGDVVWIDNLQVVPQMGFGIRTPSFTVVGNERSSFDSLKALYK